MRNRMLFLAAIALILSVGVTYLAYQVFQRQLKPDPKTTKVVVAKRNIPLGTLITTDDVKLADWPIANPIEGGFNDPTLVVDRATMTPLQTNEPILEAKLAPVGSGAGLTAVIPEGMRALSIQVNSIIGVAGFVLPGSRVDLILIAQPPSDVKGSKPGEQASKIILENLEVLAAGQNVQRNVDGKPQTVQVVTLLVTPEQAQKVALATGEGRIQLALRNPIDKVVAEPKLAVKSALYTDSTTDEPEPPPKVQKRPIRRAPVAPRPVAVAPEPRIVVVEVIQGANRSKQSFEDKELEEEIP